MYTEKYYKTIGEKVAKEMRQHRESIEMPFNLVYYKGKIIKKRRYRCG